MFPSVFLFFSLHWSGVLCICLYFFDSTVTDKFTESMYVLANEPSVALYRLQEHVRRSLPELVQHKTDMQSWEEQSQGAIYSVEYACSAVKSMTNSSLYFKNIDGLLCQAISMKEQISSSQGRSLHDVTPSPSPLVSAPHAPSTSSLPLD
ncbi:BLOC-1-related complex subunit 8 isoform X1 [Etheostoma spectabile]|uniref:BLOC-1-related complex subunit 8 isoform X1 n=1 Tax=Etheostoma spectabile TaxID=54343 RepID=UPI0013AEE301|nr:BLOC-1-related complex subunit 8 isoform X1 [Etheostoma spectabile]XP_032382325.1 BLOC-1-related complex subunit 8 isoform X1 [Etheostoma spectabile]